MREGVQQPSLYDQESHDVYIQTLGEEVSSEVELFDQISNIDNPAINSPEEFSTLFQRHPILLKIAGGLTVFTAMTGVSTYKVHRKNDEIGREDTITSEVIHGVGDLFPVDVIQGLYAPFNTPDDVAEACLNQSYDLQLVREYTDQKELSNKTLAEIEEATTVEQVSSNLQAFMSTNGIKYDLNTTTDPIEFSFVDRAKSQLSDQLFTQTKFDTNQPGALDTYKLHARALVKGLAFFPTTFNQVMIDRVVMTGDRGFVLGAAQDGLRNVATVVINMNEHIDEQTAIGTVVHEATHAAQYRIIRENSLYLRNFTGEIYGTQLPDGFEYADDSSLSVREIATKNPEYFVHDQGRVFAREYSATDAYEDGATTVEDMLAGDGLVTPNRLDWGSPYHKRQLGWLVCYETMMPGFINFIIAHDVARKGVHPTDAQNLYKDYRTQTVVELYKSFD